MIQTQENSKEHQFGSDLGPSNGEEPQFGTDLGPSGLQFFFSFFSQNRALSVTRYRVHLSCKISEKPNDQILRKFSDGRTDR